MGYRSVCSVLVILITTFVMTFVPATSFAGSGGVCANMCSEEQPEIQVTPFDGAEKWMREPTLPRAADARKPAAHLEHAYFKRLAAIADEICVEAREADEARGTSSYTAYWPALNTFNEIRVQLNKLLKSYGLGYAPDIEDFSGVTNLQILVTHWVSWIVTPPLHVCSFKLQ